MNQLEVLEVVCSRGEAVVVQSYEAQDPRREGVVAGLALCRGKSAGELLELLAEEERIVGSRDAATRSEEARRRYKLAQIEWCLDCLAAVECLEGSRSFEWMSWHPSAAALTLAREILGVAPPVP
jgi:hypothetical protein